MSDLDYIPPSKKSDLLGMVLVILLFFVLVIFLDPAKALASCVILGAFLAVIQTKPKAQRGVRFWSLISILAMAHVVGLSVIHIPEPRVGLISMPFALADGFAMWRLLNWIERRFPAEGGGGSTEG